MCMPLKSHPMPRHCSSSWVRATKSYGRWVSFTRETLIPNGWTRNSDPDHLNVGKCVVSLKTTPHSAGALWACEGACSIGSRPIWQWLAITFRSTESAPTHHALKKRANVFQRWLFKNFTDGLNHDVRLWIQQHVSLANWIHVPRAQHLSFLAFHVRTASHHI